MGDALAAPIDPYTAALRLPDNASIAYRAYQRLDGLSDEDRGQRARRRQVATSANVQRLLSRRRRDGTIRLGAEHHAYRKYQGTHWTLAALAELGYPAGDPSLQPLVDQVHEWLSSPSHLGPPSTVVIPGQADRVRRCASQEGLAIWYLDVLGLTDDRVDILASRLVEWQWPDGGWNCDRRPGARTSSVQETLLPLRGLASYMRSGGEDLAVRATVDRAAEFLLERKLLWRRHDGEPILPSWGREPARIHWPIRFYDVLSALVVMAEFDRIRDPRCDDALRLLAGKRLTDGGFPAEERTARTVEAVCSGGTFADWGPARQTVANPYVSIDATWVLTLGA